MTDTPWKSLPLPERLRAAHDWWQATISPMPNDSDVVLEAADAIERLTRERDGAVAHRKAIIQEADELRALSERLTREREGASDGR